VPARGGGQVVRDEGPAVRGLVPEHARVWLACARRGGVGFDRSDDDAVHVVLLDQLEELLAVEAGRLDMLVEEADGRFSLTAEGQGLVTTAPGSLAAAPLDLDEELRKNGMDFDVSQIKPENINELIDQLQDLSIDIDHAEDDVKIRIVLDGLRGEDSIAELCRREGIAQNLYYRWSKDFLEAGKKRLAGDTARAATSDEVIGLRREATALKEVVADLTLENRLLKKSVTADGEDGE